MEYILLHVVCCPIFLSFTQLLVLLYTMFIYTVVTRSIIINTIFWSKQPFICDMFMSDELFWTESFTNNHSFVFDNQPQYPIESKSALLISCYTLT